MTPSEQPLNNKKASEILITLAHRFTAQTVSIRELRDALSGTIYALLLFVLALPNLIPFPVPIASTITCIPLLLISLQLVVNKTTPWLPERFLNATIKQEHWHKICTYSVPFLKKLEHYIKPRFPWLVTYPADRVIAFICVLLSLLIVLPIPLGNAPPALAICCFSLALLQRDGLFVLLGIICSIASLVIISTILGGAFLMASRIF
ncbi:MAG: exopolysaccharide biosynthesis protein [Alphaproteobacteria bacterium]|nr:MAG: exopolysaccharide biosynthesis protein [Alphaproteobacteria bacterium]TAF15942.1 MAG: exopolysaccharide biosynthesis protein [Alphaproteobacteria bacterium]TAF41941.1 MAG: exopolysaccharide biosynthesis protein [Alphaproteobacteria bacterium]TAF76756.1 MAG: exopolysaccharide biosynthesis protein [Alphaproteobacteria bacterium]